MWPPPLSIWMASSGYQTPSRHSNPVLFQALLEKTQARGFDTLCGGESLLGMHCGKLDTFLEKPKTLAACSVLTARTLKACSSSKHGSAEEEVEESDKDEKNNNDNKDKETQREERSKEDLQAKAEAEAEAKKEETDWFGLGLGLGGGGTLEGFLRPCPGDCSLAQLLDEWFRWRVGPGLESVEECLPALARFAGAAKHLGSTFSAGLHTFYNHWRLACAEAHQRGVEAQQGTSSVLLEDGGAEASPLHRGSRPPPPPPPRVGIIAGITREQQELYRPFAAIWKCYAKRHGYHFVLDVVDSGQAGLAPSGFQLTWDIFEEGFAEWRPKRNWATLLAAKRHLSKFDFIVVIDLDTFVHPSCWDLPLLDTVGIVSTEGSSLEARADSTTAEQRRRLAPSSSPSPPLSASSSSSPSIYLRDSPRHQDWNTGVLILRSNKIAASFLDQAVAKRDWLLSPRPVQNAILETLLEFLWLERQEEKKKEEEKAEAEAEQEARREAAAVAADCGGPAGQGPRDDARAGDVCSTGRGSRSGEEAVRSSYQGCLPFAMAEMDWSMRTADYARCLQRQLKDLVGPFGARSSRIVSFLDPRIADVNYVPRPWEAAGHGLIHHHAGLKNWTSMLRTFRVAQSQLRLGREETCFLLERARSRTRTAMMQQCQAATAVSVCPVDDSILGGRFDVC